MAQPVDAIDLLVDQHREVEALFVRMEGLQVASWEDRDGLRGLRSGVTNSIVEALSRHAAVEELHFYPAIREHLPDGDPLATRAEEEQQHVKDLLVRLDGIDPESADYDPLLREAIADVRAHVAFEEGEVFPHMRERVAAGTLREIGTAMDRAMRLAPTHPHPHAPVKPGIAQAGGLMDKVRDVLERKKTAG